MQLRGFAHVEHTHASFPRPQSVTSSRGRGRAFLWFICAIPHFLSKPAAIAVAEEGRVRRKEREREKKRGEWEVTEKLKKKRKKKKKG